MACDENFRFTDMSMKTCMGKGPNQEIEKTLTDIRIESRRIADRLRIAAGAIERFGVNYTHNPSEGSMHWLWLFMHDMPRSVHIKYVGVPLILSVDVDQLGRLFEKLHGLCQEAGQKCD